MPPNCPSLGVVVMVLWSHLYVVFEYHWYHSLVLEAWIVVSSLRVPEAWIVVPNLRVPEAWIVVPNLRVFAWDRPMKVSVQSASLFAPVRQ